MWSPFVRNGVHLGLSFCAIFMAFSVSQNFQTSSDHEKQGSTALGILYAFFTFGNFVSSFVVSNLGSKTSLVLGSFTYVIFVAANIQYNMMMLYLSSGLIGVGASVLWTAQGVYINNCATLHEQTQMLTPSSTLGFFNGLFFAIYQMNQLLGNLLAAALFKENVSTGTIFVVMTAICTAGSFTLFFLKDPAKASATAPGVSFAQPLVGHGINDDASSLNSPSLDSQDEDLLQQKAPRRSSCSRFLSMFDSLRMLGEGRMLILLPIMLYSGLSQAFIFGSFPPLIADRSTKFFVLAALGATDALASVLVGKISDKYGRVSVLILGFNTAAPTIIFLFFWTVDQSSTYVFFLVGIVLGVSDAVFNTQIYAILGTFFEGRIEGAFSNCKLFQAGSTAIAFLLNDTLGFNWKCVMILVCLVVGMACLAAYDLSARAKGVQGSVLDGAGLDIDDSTTAAVIPISEESMRVYGEAPMDM